MSVPAYQEACSVPTDVSVVAVDCALAKVGYTRPTLHVSPAYAGVALRINQLFAHLMNIEIIRQARDIDEWWLEFDGKYAGSEGA